MTEARNIVGRSIEGDRIHAKCTDVVDLVAEGMFAEGGKSSDSTTSPALRTQEKPHKTLQPPTSRKTKKPSNRLQLF
jgi:hypothetical protein